MANLKKQIGKQRFTKLYIYIYTEYTSAVDVNVLQLINLVSPSDSGRTIQINRSGTRVPALYLGLQIHLHIIVSRQPTL